MKGLQQPIVTDAGGILRRQRPEKNMKRTKTVQISHYNSAIVNFLHCK
jgi:hypothetical protein